MKGIGTIVVVSVLGAAALGYVGVATSRRLSEAAAASPAGARTPTSAETARKEELLRENTNLGPEPALADEYDEINAKYFDGRLPTVPVRWEERLSEVGPMIAPGFRLEGLTNGRLILLDPSLRGDAKQVRRVLCHEMVHVAVWSRQHDHGPVFQQVLHQLSDAGAFEGIVASDEEKEQLHAALRTRRAALEQEDAEIGRARADLDDERQRVNAEIRDFNARMAAANQRQSDWPPESEQETVKAHETNFENRVTLFNSRVERHRADIADFDRDVQRYNLMIAYPDGLDRERMTGKDES